MRGRKPKPESRAQEFRTVLISWKRLPESLRPSLRALAHSLGTSHQLLQHYLDNLYKWQYEERARAARQAREQIKAKALAEGRPLTDDEARQSWRYQLEEFRYVGAVALLGSLAKIRQEAKRGPVHPAQVKIAKICLDAGIPGAREVLQICAMVGVKKRKTFAQIVRENPRQQEETTTAWVRRLWAECDKYNTMKRHSVITDELLERYSRSGAKKAKDNLPVVSEHTAKSFKSPPG
jgi:hypothetical protein